MFNDLPAGAANHPEAPFNDSLPHCNAKSRFSGKQADKLLAEAIDRMIAAGMKPVMQTISGK